MTENLHKRRTRDPIALAAPEASPVPTAPSRPLRHPAIPVLHLTYHQTSRSKRVREALLVVWRVANDHGATTSRFFERRWKGKWSTHVTLQSQRGFPDEDQARAWWQALVDRLRRDMPHQRLLERNLAEENFGYTTEFAARVAASLANALETIEDP